MDTETSKHLGQVLQAILDWWELVLFFIGGLIGVLVLWLRQVFATKTHVESCKDQLMKSHDKDISALHTANTQEHNEIKQDIRSILSHLLGHENDRKD